MQQYIIKIEKPCVLGQYLPPIEAIILFGESIRWETTLQLLVDVIMCGGHMNERPTTFPDPTNQLPILVSNTDMVWMAEAAMPRFGHGSFLFCLEQLYKRMSGNELKYSAVVGKPSELSYQYSERMIRKHALSLGIADKSVRRLYAIGDNLDTDIYGANLYNRHLAQIRRQRESGQDDDENPAHSSTVESIVSVLVKTGVFQTSHMDESSPISQSLAHRDTLVDPVLRKPHFVCDDVYDAVKLIFELERF